MAKWSWYASGYNINGEQLARTTSSPPSRHECCSGGDLRQLYQQYEGKWQCDCCKNNYDAMKNSQQYAYHCNQCYYDLCQQCWLGYYHPFHHHRMKPAKTEILYPSTPGCWFCGACHRSFHDLSGPSCYNCEPCGGIDLCERCFNGEWVHPLHPARGHQLLSR